MDTQDSSPHKAPRQDENILAARSLNSLDEAIILTDPSGIITLFNPAAEKLSGYTTAAAHGKKINEIIRLKDSLAAQQVKNPVFEALASGKTEHLPCGCRLLSKSEQLRTVAGYAAPITGADNSPAGTLLCLRDTSRELAADKMTRLRSKTMDATLRAVALIDSNGLILHANPAFLALWGYMAVGEVSGRPFADFFQGQQPMSAILKPGGRGTWRGELWARKKDGSLLYADGVLSTFHDDKEPSLYVLASFFDATERRLRTNQLIAANLELLALASATNAIISITDKKKLWHSICEQATAITGADHAWLGMLLQREGTLQSFCCSHSEHPYIERIALSESGTVPELTALETMAPALCRTPASSGMAPHWVEQMQKLRAEAALALPLIGASGEPLGVLTLLSSEPEHFTEQRIELYQVFATLAAVSIENLRILSALELKVEERTRELNSQKIAAEEALVLAEESRILSEDARILAESANKAKSEFLATMSHELRTPLNVVIGCSDIISEQMYGPLNEKQREYQNYIKTSARHLLSLINDILDLSKIEYGKMELRPCAVPLRQALENIIKLLGEKSMHAKVRLRLESPQDAETEFRADERKFKQIIFNLASNAIKFSKPNSEVVLRAGVFYDAQSLPQQAAGKFDPQRGYLVASVQDFGIGIRAEDLGKLFQAFTQLDSSRTREHEGSGLGLALTKKLVELHNGVIWAESEHGKGSTFTFVIPQILENGEKNG